MTADEARAILQRHGLEMTSATTDACAAEIASALQAQEQESARLTAEVARLREACTQALAPLNGKMGSIPSDPDWANRVLEARIVLRRVLIAPATPPGEEGE